MPANTSPIYSLTPKVTSVKINGVEPASNGAGTAGTDHFLVFTAGSNGSFVQRIRFNCTASAAANSSAATTLRIYLSSVGTGTLTDADTFLIGEVSVPLITSAVAHSTNATNYYDFPLNFAIPTGRYIYVTQHLTQPANTFWIATCFGGDY